MAKAIVSNSDLGSDLKVAYMYFSGMKQKEIARQLGVAPATVSRALARARDFVEVKFTVPGDEETEARLLLRYGLKGAIVVETGSSAQAVTVVAQAAAKYFTTHITSGDKVALSCGETLLETIKAVPNQPTLDIEIFQLSIEGDPASVHQAPATLVGLLKSKVSRSSKACGFQLPPAGTFENETQLHSQLIESPVVRELRQKVLNASFVFIGVGTITKGGGTPQSFLTLADSMTRGKFVSAAERLGIVGEVNNRLFDETGVDRTDEIPKLPGKLGAIVGLDDIRNLTRRGASVVAVATGKHKLHALRVVLATKIANVVITDKEMALRLLDR